VVSAAKAEARRPAPRPLSARRLLMQGLVGPAFRNPEEAVSWFGAVQAQDYFGALWALGMRTRRATEALIENAETRRAIVRTWPLRGTLHFVAADDVRWITKLLAPRVIARNQARWKREFGLDASLAAKARDVLARALEGGKRLERAELYAALEARKIHAGQSRGLHILLWLAMQGHLCLAGRSGKQQTFALLDEWVPDSRKLEGEAALAELARRYFTSHGPATLKDFVWWSGLTVKDALVAIEAAKQALRYEILDDIGHWSGATRALASRTITSPVVRLLPAYDEFAVGYQDRSALMPAGRRMNPMALLGPSVLVDGVVAGHWKRRVVRDSVRVDVKLLRKLSPAEAVALDEAQERYQEFLRPSA
jgi:hypothetical protein